MKTLFEICISYLSRNFTALVTELSALPPNCKELIVEWLGSHDQLMNSPGARALLAHPDFAKNLTQIQFFLSDQVTDECLQMFGAHNRQLDRVVLVHCSKVTDAGVLAITKDQPNLTSLELRGLRNLTSKNIQAVLGVESVHLKTVDLSDCANICSSGVVDLLSRNQTVTHLYLNNCKSLDDVALYAIASYCGRRLLALELDFLNDLDPSTAIAHLTNKCPNLLHLSLCRYFEDGEQMSLVQDVKCQIQCSGLRDLDLYGNYFNVLPFLPPNIRTLRLSCSGEENANDLNTRLTALTALHSFRLVLMCPENSDESGTRTNAFLCSVVSVMGDKITGLQIQCDVLQDEAIRAIDRECAELTQLCLDVDTVPSRSLSRLISLSRSRAAQIRCVKLSRCNVTWRVLFTVARYCVGLVNLEMSYMTNVDDRFLKLLAHNCRRLATVNFNGCKWVTDRGLCALARACSAMREVRVRATSVTDTCVYCLAQFCPNLEWIAHADYTGRPTFSPEALQTLRDSCVNRVIC